MASQNLQGGCMRERHKRQELFVFTKIWVLWRVDYSYICLMDVVRDIVINLLSDGISFLFGAMSVYTLTHIKKI